MSQGKSAVSVEMKQVIGTLCRLLKAVGLEAVPPPETFRRAKFAGGVDVVKSLFCLSTLVRHCILRHCNKVNITN